MNTMPTSTSYEEQLNFDQTEGDGLLVFSISELSDREENTLSEEDANKTLWSYPQHKNTESNFTESYITQSNATGSSGRKESINTGCNGPNKAVNKPYQSFLCIICQKNCKSRSQLKRHSVAHTGDKPYQCKLCLRKFFYRYKLRQHSNGLCTGIIEEKELNENYG